MGRPALDIGTYGKVSRQQLGRKKWRASARFRDHDGVTRVVTATAETGAGAEKRLKLELARRATPTGGEFLGPESTIVDLAEVWFDELRTEEAVVTSTIDGYEAVYKRTIEDPLGNLRIREASTARLDRHVKGIKKSGKSAEARHTKVILGLMFDLAVRHDAIKVNPARAISKTPKKKNEVRVLDVEDIPAIRDLIEAWTTRARPGPKTNRDLADAVSLHLGTGCRIGEVLAFRWCDIEVDASGRTWLTVCGTLVTPKKKGGGPTFRQPFPKSHASWRRLLLPPFVVAILEARRELTGASPLGAVFETRNHTWKAPNNVRRQWRAARSGSAYEWVVPHTLRKSVAQRVDDEAGRDAAQLQLGHVKGSPVTAEHYLAKATDGPDVTAVLQAFAPVLDEELG